MEHKSKFFIESDWFKLDLDIYQFNVLLAIRSFCGKDGTEVCMASTESIAHFAHICRRQIVSKCLKQLERFQVISVYRKHRKSSMIKILPINVEKINAAIKRVKTLKTEYKKRIVYVEPIKTSVGEIFTS